MSSFLLESSRKLARRQLLREWGSWKN
ncbi:hypothetical protein F8388_014618 [Cannabis sativa]|uniref:Uncharacterized protein n=1 Tax=Cannabis sativa TaxID=3483 RepID=A0A7J6EU88_CANSA|nr:hypothetical protein F8388_014618 [Cannabis sativa]KAF4361938.1 hypothetical protein G4B88_024514 [Cannabis sativa]